MACKLSDLADRSDQSFMDDKRAGSQDEFVLERVQGLTSTTLHSLASNPVTGWVAFPAACVLVLLDPKTNDQKFIESPSLRNISCCAFTDDGRFVAFGETGMKPHIAMWNLREHKECHKFVTDTTVRAIFLHPTSPIIISLGLKESVIDVWDYVKGMRMASCKWQTKPLSLTIPRTGSSIVVCGHRKISLFNISKVDSNSYETNVFQDRRTVLLGKQSEYTFVDIESGRGQHERTVYSVTSCGYLCEIKLGDILIDKAIKVDTQIFCVRYNTELLFVGCPAGVVKICDPDNLTVTAAVSLSSLLGPSAMPKVGNKCYLDVCTLVVDESEKIVTCVYADCSMHSWQIGTDGEKIVCSAIEPGMGSTGIGGHPASKSNLLRAFIGCCEKTKTCNDLLTKLSVVEQSKPPQQFGGRRLVNENRASYQNANAVRFTPDGKDVICGNEEGEIKVYELSTGILRRVIEAHSSQVTCIELMYDNDYQLICSGGRDRVMFVLNARNDFSLVQVLCDHSAAITAISLVNHKGVLTLVSAAADNVILIRRAILGGMLRFTITGEIAQTNCSRSFFVTSDYIALGGKDSQIKVFKADPVFVSKPLKTIDCQKLSPAKAGFKAIDIDPSSSFMAVSQTNGNISVYHLQTGQPVASLPLQSDITNIHFTSDLKYMVSSTSNGCDLVWRLPERMTEFMQSKQEKLYQIETNKEITSETCMSCVKVCKEEVEEEEDGRCINVSKENDEEGESTNQHRHGSHQKRWSSGTRRARRETNATVSSLSEEGFHQRRIAQNSSNHNSEWDRTPSIDSMSILDNCSSPIMFAGKTKGDRDGVDGRSCSSCSSESLVNCSTCTHSVSTTTHTSCCSAVATESSASAQHGRTEPSHRLRFYCGSDHELFGQVLDEGHCIKVGPFKEDSPAKKEIPCRETSEPALRSPPKQETQEEVNLQKIDNVGCISTVQESSTDLHTCEHGEKQSGSQKEFIVPAATEGQTVVTVHSLSEKETEKHEIMSLSTAETKEKSQNFDESLDFREQQDMRTSPMNNPQNKSQNSERNHFIASPLPEQKYIKSKSILEKALFYEGIMRGDLTSQREVSARSPTRQHTAAVGEAVRSLSKRRAEALREPHFEEEINAKKECCGQVSADMEASFHWTPLTTPDYSNTSSNITNLVPSSSSTLDFCNSYKMLKGGPPCLDKLNLETQRIERNLGPSSNENDDPALHSETGKTGDCDTTQMEQESFRSEIGDDTMIAKDDRETAGERTETYNYESGDAEASVGDEDSTILDLSINLAKINLKVAEDERSQNIMKISNATVGEFNERSCPEDPFWGKSRDTHERSTWNIQKNPNTALAYLNSDRAKVMVLEQEEDGSIRRQSVLDQLEQEGFMVPEKYRSALRSCMQLSNSQETFATLRVDTNDLELMAFLSHALKKKLVAAGLVGLSCNEIDTLLNTGPGSADKRRGGVEDVVTPEGAATGACNAQVIGMQISCEAKNCLAKMSDPGIDACNVGDHAKLANDSEACDTAAEKEHDSKSREPCSGDKKLPTQSGTLSGRNLRSPLGEARRKMYKSILSRLPCARTSNKNRSHTDSESDLSLEFMIRSLVHESSCGGMPYSDTYLNLETCAENLFLPSQCDLANHSIGAANKLGCSTNTTVTSQPSPRLCSHYLEKERSKVQTREAKTADQAKAEKFVQKLRTNGHNQSRTSPRQDCSRVTSRSISLPASATRREPHVRERTAKRCPDLRAPSTRSGAHTGDRVGEESDQSRGKTFQVTKLSHTLSMLK